MITVGLSSIHDSQNLTCLAIGSNVHDKKPTLITTNDNISPELVSLPATGLFLLLFTGGSTVK
jgi:hypothetical protein